MVTKYYEAAIQMAKAKVNAIKRNLNACGYMNKYLLNEYNVRAKQVSILTGEPFEEYKPKRTKRQKNKNKLK